MSDVDPPCYDARCVTSWLVLFMTHVASCGAAAVICEDSNTDQDVSIIDASNPNFRLKMAKRLGMPRHPDNMKAIKAAAAKVAAQTVRSNESSEDDALGLIVLL